MSPGANQDPFDLGFDADDEFASSHGDPWREPSSERSGADPFADFPLARQHAEDDPFSDRMAVAPAAAAAADAGRPAVGYAPELASAADGGLGDVSVPRISIHVFCARPDTAEMIEQAASDRRMARAATTVFPGGVQAAVAQYQINRPLRWSSSRASTPRPNCWPSSTCWPRSVIRALRS